MANTPLATAQLTQDEIQAAYAHYMQNRGRQPFNEALVRNFLDQSTSFGNLGQPNGIHPGNLSVSRMMDMYRSWAATPGVNPQRDMGEFFPLLAQGIQQHAHPEAVVPPAGGPMGMQLTPAGTPTLPGAPTIAHNNVVNAGRYRTQGTGTPSANPQTAPVENILNSNAQTRRNMTMLGTMLRGMDMNPSDLTPETRHVLALSGPTRGAMMVAMSRDEAFDGSTLNQLSQQAQTGLQNLRAGRPMNTGSASLDRFVTDFSRQAGIPPRQALDILAQGPRQMAGMNQFIQRDGRIGGLDLNGDNTPRSVIGRLESIYRPMADQRIAARPAAMSPDTP